MDLIFDEDVEPTLDTNDLMKAFKGTDFDTNASIEPTFAAED